VTLFSLVNRAGHLFVRHTSSAFPSSWNPIHFWTPSASTKNGPHSLGLAESVPERGDSGLSGIRSLSKQLPTRQCT